MTELPLVVVAKSYPADGVAVIRFRHRDGGLLPEWTLGAHLDLVLTPHITRQYSLGGAPADRSEWTIGVLREAESNYSFIAGGIGITPIITMVAPVDRLGANWRLVYRGGAGAAWHSLRS